jgi:hypothetical protein
MFMDKRNRLFEIFHEGKHFGLIFAKNEADALKMLMKYHRDKVFVLKEKR